MITSVSWQYVVLEAVQGGSHRIARRYATGSPPIVGHGVDSPSGDFWTANPLPPESIPYNELNYTFAFWSLRAVDATTGQRSATAQGFRPANDSHSGGMWSIDATAYYVWDFAGRGGDNVVDIDAFDVQAGRFIPDDFVDVTPDDAAGSLTAAANDGEINTSAPFPAGSPITIAARDALRGLQFGYWLDVPSLRYSAVPAERITIGAPDAHDIVAHPSDIAVAFAFYNEVQQTFVRPNQPWLYDPWWWIKTLGGKEPPKPWGPWMRDILAAAQLGQVAEGVSPKLRTRVLGLALEQLAVSAAEIKKAMREPTKGAVTRGANSKASVARTTAKVSKGRGGKNR